MRRGKTHPRLTCLGIVKNPGRQAGKTNRKKQRCREDRILHRGSDAKRKNVADGLRTPEDQAARPTHIPSELLDIAPCQAVTMFTYLYIEVLRFVAKPP